MKKLLLIGAILVTGAISFADGKTDYEKAVKLAGENKITDAVKVLEGVAKGTDASYAQKANLELGAYYLKDNKIAQAKPYYKQLGEMDHLQLQKLLKPQDYFTL